MQADAGAFTSPNSRSSLDGGLSFHIETDVNYGINKIYEFGFTERVNSAKSLTTAIDSLKRQEVLPQGVT
jgi:hypothetical protein